MTTFAVHSEQAVPDKPVERLKKMNFPFEIDHEKLNRLASDLNIEYPRSPKEKIADYVFAARALDKCRAYLAGTLGDYEFNCKLDRRLFDFTTINAIEFMEFVATG